MKQLSEQLKNLSDRVADAQTKVATAKKESKQKVEASIKQAKVDAKARQESFKDSAKAKQTAAAVQWQEMQDNYHQKVQQIKNKIETEKETRDVKKANKRADDAEAY